MIRHVKLSVIYYNNKWTKLGDVCKMAGNGKWNKPYGQSWHDLASVRYNPTDSTTWPTCKRNDTYRNTLPELWIAHTCKNHTDSIDKIKKKTFIRFEIETQRVYRK